MRQNYVSRVNPAHVSPINEPETNIHPQNTLPKHLKGIKCRLTPSAKFTKEMAIDIKIAMVIRIRLRMMMLIRRLMVMTMIMRDIGNHGDNGRRRW
jgi:hypothetical protein